MRQLELGGREHRTIAELSLRSFLGLGGFFSKPHVVTSRRASLLYFSGRARLCAEKLLQIITAPLSIKSLSKIRSAPQA
jgi:hypothetical protein